jgi:hypothetical protein
MSLVLQNHFQEVKIEHFQCSSLHTKQNSSFLSQPHESGPVFLIQGHFPSLHVCVPAVPPPPSELRLSLPQNIGRCSFFSSQKALLTTCSSQGCLLLILKPPESMPPPCRGLPWPPRGKQAPLSFLPSSYLCLQNPYCSL